MDELSCAEGGGGTIMSSPFETYVDKIIQEIDGKKEDNADLKEELLTHLTQAKEDFIKEGHNDEQATHLALQHFGDATSIGGDMQQALFPHRRLSLMILAFLSLFSIFSTYITALVVNKDAFIIWLCIAV